MKILLYSDLHISKTASIMPIQIDNSKFTFRQQKIIELGKLLSKSIKDNNIDLIINCGDTFDSQINDSSNIECASEFFEQFNDINIPHYLIVGNHEMLNDKFNSVSILNNINNIKVIREPQIFNIDNKEFAFMPYQDYRDIKELPNGDFLFSHIDIEGSPLNDKVILPGLNKSILKKYKLVFNGHVHKDSIIENVINLGSCTTHSFSDANDFIPKYYIFDSDTFNLTPYKINLFPLFRKIEINNIEELNNYLSKLNNNYSYILNINCPFELKDSIQEILSKDNNIINYKITTKISEKLNENIEKPIVDVNNNIDIKKEFDNFIKTQDLSYPINLYQDIINNI